jgi:hypothetical protein
MQSEKDLEAFSRNGYSLFRIRILSAREIVNSQFMNFVILRYLPSYHRCFHLRVISKFVAAKILFQRWKHMIIARRRIPLIQLQSV